MLPITKSLADVQPMDRSGGMFWNVNSFASSSAAPGGSPAGSFLFLNAYLHVIPNTDSQNNLVMLLKTDFLLPFVAEKTEDLRS